jgi:pilus assembly protein Flp/PilA
MRSPESDVGSCHWLHFFKDLHMRKLINRFRRDERGAAMVEYGLLVGLIALVVAAGATILGNDISTMFSSIGSYLSGIPIPA